jgi:hypothetical protein
MKDDKRSIEVAQGEWCDVELIGGGDTLTRKYVSSKELNLLKRNSELVVLVASW